MSNDQRPRMSRAAEMAFGFDRETDERSLTLFLDRFARPELLDVLLPRLTESEITGLLDQLSKLLQSHLQESEYHRLFLRDR